MRTVTRISMLACSTVAAIAWSSASAKGSAIHGSGPVPDSAYWIAKAQCWADLAISEKRQGDTRGTADIAAANAQKLRTALDRGEQPTPDHEQPIHSQQISPGRDSRHGRAGWNSDMKKIAGALSLYREKQCRTARSACLEVALQSVWENMEETHGARWNHGRPELDAALELAAGASEDVAHCNAPPEPIQIAAPPRPVRQHSMSADVLFAFDSADLTAAGKIAVAAVAKEMTRGGRSRFRVVGHTDSIGRAVYNQRLSERRAQSITSLLASRLPDSEIEFSGVGSSEPVVTCAQDRDPATIACHAPNRRVVVDILE